MERLLDIKDAAEFLNVSEMSIRRWTNSGTLNCYRVGGKRERRFRMSDLEAFLHGIQSRGMIALGYRGLRVPEGSHLTHFYSQKDEAIQVSTAFVLAGLKDNEMVLVVMPSERRRDLLNNLERQGRSIDGDLQSGRLNFSAGMDSPEAMARHLAGFMQGAERLRVVGDMIWALEKDWNLAALGALEEAADFMPRSEGGLLLCQYSLADFSGTHIMMAAESHRQIIYKGRLERSPYCSG